MDENDDIIEEIDELDDETKLNNSSNNQEMDDSAGFKIRI